jgi:hypothetical protein
MGHTLFLLPSLLQRYRMETYLEFEKPIQHLAEQIARS